MLVELRAWINNIDEVIEKLKNLGARDLGTYAFIDHLYDSSDEKYDFEEESFRLRNYQISNWDQKKICVTHKRKTHEGVREIIFTSQFDTMLEANSKISESYKLVFSANRKGHEFSFNDLRIFVEDIQYLRPSIEILGNNSEHVMAIFNYLECYDILKYSVPQLILNEKNREPQTCSDLGLNL